MPKCVVFSERAFVSLLVEVEEKVFTETGGVFLGFRNDDIWYVIESVDPGPNSIFKKAYFEYDQEYINHLINKLSRIYKIQLDLIGLWHRHPGSFDRFSGTDDKTNTSFAEINGAGAISAIVNIDPVFRLTLYEVTIPLQYRRIPFVIGDSYIPNYLMELKNPIYLQELMDENESNTGLKKFSLFNRTKAEEKSNDKADKRIQIQQYSITTALYEFFKDHDEIGDVAVCPSLDLENGLDAILVEMESDLEFFNSMGIGCELTLQENNSFQIVLSMLQERLSLVICSDDNGKVCIHFEGHTMEYKSGLFKEMYNEILLKSGVKE